MTKQHDKKECATGMIKELSKEARKELRMAYEKIKTYKDMASVAKEVGKQARTTATIGAMKLVSNLQEKGAHLPEIINSKMDMMLDRLGLERKAKKPERKKKAAAKKAPKAAPKKARAKKAEPKPEAM